jgi:hypothetical protein
MIKKVKGGYKVLSGKTGKNRGGPYKTRKEAGKRLKQVEFFKRRKDEVSVYQESICTRASGLAPPGVQRVGLAGRDLSRLIIAPIFTELPMK